MNTLFLLLDDIDIFMVIMMVMVMTGSFCIGSDRIAFLLENHSSLPTRLWWCDVCVQELIAIHEAQSDVLVLAEFQNLKALPQNGLRMCDMRWTILFSWDFCHLVLGDI
jgi:hypothetical protein